MSIVNPKRDELMTQIKSLENIIKSQSGKEFNKSIINLKQTKNQKIKFLTDEIIKTQNSLSDNLSKLNNFDFIDKNKKMYKYGVATIEEINKENVAKYGNKLFEENPAIQLAKKGQAYAKAITSNEFADAMKKFATTDGVDVSHPEIGRASCRERV